MFKKIKAVVCTGLEVMYERKGVWKRNKKEREKYLKKKELQCNCIYIRNSYT